MAKEIEITYKGCPIYKGNIVSGEFKYKAPEGIRQEEWMNAILDLMAKFQDLLNKSNNSTPPKNHHVAYAHAKF